MKWWYSAIFMLLMLPASVLAYTEETEGGILGAEVIPYAPKPGEEVIIRLDTSPASFRGATIRWEVNGTPATSGVRGNELTTTVGEAGTITRIEALVSRRADLPITKTITINPATASILVSPDTYTPYGYRGAPEVSAGSDMVLTALPIMRTTLGNPVPVRDIEFTWRSGGTVLAEGLGIDSISFTAPASGSAREVSVQASALGGQIVAIEKVSIAPITPEIFFYHEHPTLGTRRSTPIETINFAEQEVTVRAEPYFFSYGDPLDISWSVDGVGVLPDARDVRLLTVRRASDSAAQALIDLLVENTSRVLQTARSSFILGFGQRNFNF